MSLPSTFTTQAVTRANSVYDGILWLYMDEQPFSYQQIGDRKLVMIAKCKIRVEFDNTTLLNISRFIKDLENVFLASFVAMFSS